MAMTSQTVKAEIVKLFKEKDRLLDEGRLIEKQYRRRMTYEEERTAKRRSIEIAVQLTTCKFKLEQLRKIKREYPQDSLIMARARLSR